MKIEALKSFCGALSMLKGEIRECNNEVALTDLLNAGYIREIRAEPERDKGIKRRRRVKGESQ